MNDFLPYVIIGITAGSIFGLAGVGLVLTYKTSGIFNFAHGAVATVAAYAFYFLHVEHGLPWPVAACSASPWSAPPSAGLLELLARRLVNVSPVWQIVATIGLVLVVEGFFNAQYGSAAVVYPSVPADHRGVHGGWCRRVLGSGDHHVDRRGGHGSAVRVLPDPTAGLGDARRRRQQ